MTRSIYVYIELDGQGVPAGLLKCEIEDGKVRASSFRYGVKYLGRKNAIPVDIASLPLLDSEFTTDENFDIFTGIKDAAPDTWGRAVMERRANREMREDEFLLATNENRVGALSFSDDLSGPKRIFPWRTDQEAHDILNLDAVFQAYSDYTQADRQQMENAMRRYIAPGSSLGGARPKASCIYDGSLHIAKFQKENDPFDFVRAEYATMNLAKKCGLNIPDIHVENISDKSVFLIRRFDRANNLKLHFNSSLAVLRETELSFFHSSYLSIAEALTKYTKNPENDQKELFKRMVFNGLCNNNDDHLRNHAFLHNPKSKAFALSPAYDILPNTNTAGPRRLAIGCGIDAMGSITREFSKASVVRAADAFSLDTAAAEEIFTKMESFIHQSWRNEFLKSGFSQAELRTFEPCFQNA